MEGLHEERFGGSGECRSRDGGLETVCGDGSEIRLLTKKGKKIDDQYRCQPHPGLEG